MFPPGIAENVTGLDDVIEHEVMRDKLLGLSLPVMTVLSSNVVINEASFRHLSQLLCRFVAGARRKAGGRTFVSAEAL